MESFYRALLTPQVKILGKKLKPFSLWHQLILKALDNAFITGRDVEAIDLMVALKVCQIEYPLRSNLDFTFKEKVQIAYLSKSHVPLFMKCAAFKKYLHEHCQGPEYWEQLSSDSGTRTISAPDELFFVSNLLRSGIPYDRAWKMSVGEALWLSASLFELQGNDTTYSDPLEEQIYPPDIEDLTEEEIYQQAIKDLGKERANELMKLRSKNARN